MNEQQWNGALSAIRAEASLKEETLAYLARRTHGYRRAPVRRQLGAALAAMTAVVCWLKHLSWAVPVMLFVLIAAAAAVYFGCLLLFRNDTVMELLHKGLERLQKHGKGRNI